jgi:hypothetical protein
MTGLGRLSCLMLIESGCLQCICSFSETSLKLVLLSYSMLCLLNRLCQWVFLSGSIFYVLNKIIVLVSHRGFVFQARSTKL